MKYFLTLLLSLCCLITYAQNSVIEKIANMDGVSSVYISKAMLEMATGMDSFKSNGIDIGKLAGKIESILIISCDKAVIATSIKREIDRLNLSSNYKELMRINEPDNKVNIYLREINNKAKEFIMINSTRNSINIISITGNLSMEEIQNITRNKK